MPVDDFNVPTEEPNMALWQVFRMDEWIQQVVDNCPAALAATVPGTDGQTVELFSTVLGRLMLGRTEDATFTPVSKDFSPAQVLWSWRHLPEING